jgi:hypothetical protein
VIDARAYWCLDPLPDMPYRGLYRAYKANQGAYYPFGYYMTYVQGPIHFQGHQALGGLL